MVSLTTETAAHVRLCPVEGAGRQTVAAEPLCTGISFDQTCCRAASQPARKACKVDIRPSIRDCATGVQRTHPGSCAQCDKRECKSPTFLGVLEIEQPDALSVSQHLLPSSHSMRLHPLVRLVVLMQDVSAGEGEPITALKVSLDGLVLAVQRSKAFLQFVYTRHNKTFVQVLHFVCSPCAAF